MYSEAVKYQGVVCWMLDSKAKLTTSVPAPKIYGPLLTNEWRLAE